MGLGMAVAGARKIAVIGAAVAMALAGPAAAQSSKGNPANGAALFKQRCAVCHSVAMPPVPGVAPNLAGVVGRKAGSTDFK